MDTQTTTIYSTLLASLAFLSILLAMFMFAIFRQYRFRIKEYEWQLAREVELIDTERKRMHIDLHDEIGSGLASIGILVQQLPVQDLTVHSKVLKQVQSLRSKIREIAYNFIPPSLSSLGLKTTLIELFEEINSEHKIKVKSKLEFDDRTFLPKKTIHVYRIIKEILTNTLKHASCSTIRCTLRIQQKMLILIISDNGVGFDTANKKWMSKGAGLSHIYSRAKLLHATITLSSIPTNGTRYEIAIPLDSLLNEKEHG